MLRLFKILFNNSALCEVSLIQHFRNALIYKVSKLFAIEIVQSNVYVIVLYSIQLVSHPATRHPHSRIQFVFFDYLEEEIEDTLLFFSQLDGIGGQNVEMHRGLLEKYLLYLLGGVLFMILLLQFMDFYFLDLILRPLFINRTDFLPFVCFWGTEIVDTDDVLHGLFRIEERGRRDGSQVVYDVFENSGLGGFRTLYVLPTSLKPLLKHIASVWLYFDAFHGISIYNCFVLT